MCIYRSIGARSRNHCCSRKARSITYSEYACVALVIQHAKRMHHKAICDLPCSSIYRVSQEECARIREGVPYVKVYRYNPKHLCPKLNGYGDNGKGKVWYSGRSTHCTCQLTTLSMPVLECGFILRKFSSCSQ